RDGEGEMANPAVLVSVRKPQEQPRDPHLRDALPRNKADRRRVAAPDPDPFFVEAELEDDAGDRSEEERRDEREAAQGGRQDQPVAGRTPPTVREESGGRHQRRGRGNRGQEGNHAPREQRETR